MEHKICNKIELNFDRKKEKCYLQFRNVTYFTYEMAIMEAWNTNKLFDWKRKKTIIILYKTVYLPYFHGDIWK